MLSPQPQPQVVFSDFSGSPDTLRAMIRAAHGPRGEQSVLVRAATEAATSGLVPKDYLGEIVAVRNWVAENVRYMNDPLHVEWVKDPQRLIEERMHGEAVGDCDDIATLIATMCLQLGRICEFVVAGFGEPGHFSHVFVRVLEPKSGQWIVCDPVAGTNERQMLQRVTTYETWSLDEPLAA
jgi:transglutaminase-like putative cysteine protease